MSSSPAQLQPFAMSSRSANSGPLAVPDPLGRRRPPGPGRPGAPHLRPDPVAAARRDRLRGGNLALPDRRAVPVRDGRPLPRREVMVTCDVVRAALVAVMLVPRMPLDVLIALLYAVTAFQPPFDAARSAILRDIVQGERYALAAATMQSTFLTMVVAGAAVGGLTVALLGARPALGFDAATFVVSALLIKFGVLARPAAATSVPNALRQLGGEVRVVFGDRALRILLIWPRTSRPTGLGCSGCASRRGPHAPSPSARPRSSRQAARPARYAACRWIPTATCALGRTVTASAMLSEPSGGRPPQTPPRPGGPIPPDPLCGMCPPIPPWGRAGRAGVAGQRGTGSRGPAGRRI